MGPPGASIQRPRLVAARGPHEVADVQRTAVDHRHAPAWRQEDFSQSALRDRASEIRGTVRILGVDSFSILFKRRSFQKPDLQRLKCAVFLPFQKFP